MLRKFWVLVLVLGVAGCANLKMSLNPSGPVTEQEIDNARADQVPVLIYDTSFNHGATPQDAGPLTVKLINVSDTQIDLITLLVVSCAGAGGREQGVYATLPVKGPFAPKAVYETHPTIDSSAGWDARETSQMTISAADVLLHDGSKLSFTGKDISKLFGSQLTNYCAAAN